MNAELLLTDNEDWIPQYGNGAHRTASVLSPVLLAILLPAVDPAFMANEGHHGLASALSRGVALEQAGTFSVAYSQETSTNPEAEMGRFLKNLLENTVEMPPDIGRAISANLFELL